MPPATLAGHAMTVLGPTAGEAMGITLPHEHLLIDFAVMFKELAAGSERGLSRQPASLANLGWVRQHFMCHVERTVADRSVLPELVATGVLLEYDLFGLETSYYPHNPAFDMPNDGERMRQILLLIERGHLDQVLMSHDIDYKHCPTKWGGFDYHHLLVDVVPRPRAQGAEDKTIESLLVDNSRRAFAYA
jgi:predicted metal-dependent phosphotriesterase family hydrolase